MRKRVTGYFDGDDLVLPIYASVAGTWGVRIDGVTTPVTVSTASFIRVANDLFPLEEDVEFQIVTPNNTAFENTLFVIYLSNETLTNSTPIGATDFIEFNVTEETQFGYTDARIIGARSWDIFVDGFRNTSPVYNGLDGFTWSFALDANIAIRIFK